MSPQQTVPSEELRLSEERLRLATEVAEVGTYDWDLLTGKHTWSPTMEQIFGLSPGSFEGTTEAFCRLVHPEDLEYVQRALGSSLQEHCRIEFRAIIPDGTVRWICCKSQILLGQNGEPVRRIGVAFEITDRKRVEQRLGVQYAITRILAESATLASATPAILKTICNSLDWETGAIWEVDRESGELRYLDTWQREGDGTAPPAAVLRNLRVDRGIGLLGCVWESGEPLWVPDITADDLYPRESSAGQNKLHGAFGFPLRSGQEVVGVMEFFCRDIREPDQDLLSMFAAIGSQIGQVIERMRAEEALRRSYEVEKELRRRADAASDRAARLQTVTTTLCEAYTAEQVADAIVAESISAMNASAALLYLLSEDGSMLVRARTAGYHEAAEKFHAFTPDDGSLPITDAVRTRRLLTFSTLDEQNERYPYLAEQRTSWNQALATIPLLWKERVVGVIGLAFENERAFDPEDCELMLNIAQQCAQALERARLYDAKVAARAAAETSLQALQASETKFRRLVESNVIGVMFGDSDSITGANQRFLDTVGYTYEDLLGGKLNWARMTPPEFRHLDEHGVREVRERGTFAPYEKEFIRKDGMRVPVLTGGASLLSKHSFHWVCFVIDLTERRRLQDQLLHSQKFESLSVLAGGIAHDFNNLLTGIMGNASLALELAPKGPIRVMLDDVLNASQQASDLTRQMLAYAGRGRFHSEPLDLAKIVRDVYPLIKAAIPKDVEVRIETNGGRPVIMGDASQIRQLVMNLVMNAAESVKPGASGSVLVTTAVEDVAGDLAFSDLEGTGIEPGPHAALRVIDNGAGMDSETKSKIFDPFFSTKFTGRGLGLAAVSGIVRGHKGAIQVRTSPGAGATFTVLLPLGSGRPAWRKKSILKHRSRGAGTILVVEDEGIVRQTIQKTLEHYGYKVLLAEDGRQAVETFRENADRISLVVLDLTMPVMSGDTALAILRSIRPSTPVIISSGYDQSEVVKRFPGQVIEFLQKPYTASQLAERIKTVLAPAKA